jgi:hypothetical protein
MVRIVAGVLLALLVTAGAAFAFVPSQRLGVDLRGGTPLVERQAAYADSQSIQLLVHAPQASAATLVGVGPDGTNLRYPLARGAGDTFSNRLQLPAAGLWSLAVATVVGQDVRTTQSFGIDVADGNALLGEASIFLSLAVASIAAGVGLLLIAKPRRASLG